MKPTRSMEPVTLLRLYLTTAICLFAACCGCRLGNTNPIVAPQSTSNIQAPPPVKAEPSQPALIETADYRADLKNDSEQDSTSIGLTAFLQDDDSSSRRSNLKQESPIEELPSKEQDKLEESETPDSIEWDEPGDTTEELIESVPVVDLPESSTSDNEFPLPVEAVLQSTLDFYPEIEVVIEELRIADGAQIAASGSFDTKLKISSENTPIGFYETYRSKFEIERPTFNGGSVYAGYRFGRGDIEPWYLERNTNAGGELKLGANWALLRNRAIDSRRVALWQSEIKRNAVAPVVHQQLLQVFRDAEIAYWNWVTAGQIYLRSVQQFRVAKNRVDQIEERIKAGDLAAITRTDNQRSILSREVKLIKAKAKLDQAAIKLSLYYRGPDGTPQIVNESQLPQQDSWTYQVPSSPEQLVSEAISCRPETKLLALDIESLNLDIANAKNNLLPELNAQVAVSQDIGRPTSASAAASSSTQTLFVFFDEKDQFQADVGVFLTQSLQRRKALGKIRSLTGKRRQLQIKRSFVEQKIVAEVQQNHQLTVAAKEQIRAAEENFSLAQTLSDAARERITTGDADLFEIILREQQELDAAIELAASQFAFFSNRANLNASIGCARHQAYERLISGRLQN